MTIYASPTTQPAPPYGGPPTPPPQHWGRPPTRRAPRPRRAAILTATSALLIAAAATVTAAASLANPVSPAQHIVNVVPPPPAEYSNADIQAAKTTACDAWEQAALTTAAAAKERAAVAPDPGAIGDRFDARANEKRVSRAEVSFLRTQIKPAAPRSVVAPITAWIASEIDRLHFVNMRDWPTASAALQRGNDLVDVIAPACGLR